MITDVITAGGVRDDLSLREAITITNNLGVPHRIAFDALVFPLGGMPASSLAPWGSYPLSS